MYGHTLSSVQKNSPSIAQDSTLEEVVVSSKVLDLSMEELVQANRILNSSEMLHNLVSMNNMLSRGYRMNVVEQKILEEFYNRFHSQYKSPLALALSEAKEGI